MSKLGNWYGEYRRESAFLREHKEEHMEIVKPVLWWMVAVILCGLVMLIADIVRDGVPAGFSDTMIGIWFTIMVAVAIVSLVVSYKARESINILKKKYNYNHT